MYIEKNKIKGLHTQRILLHKKNKIKASKHLQKHQFYLISRFFFFCNFSGKLIRGLWKSHKILYCKDSKATKYFWVHPLLLSLSRCQSISPHRGKLLGIGTNNVKSPLLFLAKQWLYMDAFFFFDMMATMVLLVLIRAWKSELIDFL